MPPLDTLRDLLQREAALGNTIQQWLVAQAVAVGTAIALHFVKRLVAGRIQALATRHPNDWLETAAELATHTRHWFLVILALYGGSLLLVLPDKAAGIVNTAAIIALLVQGALWGDALGKSYLMRQARRRAETDAAGATTLVALAFLARLTLWTIMILLILANLGINVSAMVAGLGIGGVAVALAAQNILGDLFASTSIVLDKPFVLGDFIIVGDDMGTVEHIGLKTTRVRSLSGEQIVFGNSDLLKSRIRNFQRMNQRRVQFSLGVAYETPPEKVAAIPAMLREAVESAASTRFDRAHFKSYGDSSLNFEVVYFVLSADYNLYMDIQQAINLTLLRRFADERITFAYPTRTVYLQTPGDAGK